MIGKRDRIGERGLMDMSNHIVYRIGEKLTVVVVGCGCGDVAEVLAKVLCPAGALLAIDGGQPEDQATGDYLGRIVARNGNIAHAISTSDAARDHVVQNGLADVVYIDRPVQGTLGDEILRWLPAIKRDGFVAGSGCADPLMKEMLENLLGKQPDRTFADGSWVYQRKS